MSPLAEALDRLVPPFAADGGDWGDVVTRAGDTRRTRRLLLAAAVVGAAALLATPAFGLRGFVADLLGRIDVPFAGGQPAPTEVKAEFYDLGLGGPPSIAPGVIAAQTRKVATFHTDGKTHVLYVAPTRKGGFCWIATGAFGGCWPSPVGPARRLNVTWQMAAPSGPHWIEQVGGMVRAHHARRLLVRYADGSSTDVRFYYVSKPIGAGFFFLRVPSGHDTAASRVAAVEALDADGKVVARQPFRYSSGRSRPRPTHVRPAVPRRFLPKPIGNPTGPLQQARADGVSVVAGHNGVVVFDLSQLSPTLQAQLAPGHAYYACLRRLPYHPELVGAGGLPTRRRGNGVVTRMNRVRAPYDGCEIGGSYGHTWPDRFGSHAAVEVPFTKRGRRYFEDRATARDLAAFIRSRPYRTFRRLGGADLGRALRASRYAGKLTAIASADARLPAHRIGYVLRPDGAIFVELSRTGRRFEVTVSGDRVRAPNMKGLGAAFF